MRLRVLLTAAFAVSSFGALAAQASANPVATICSDVNIVVNGQELVNDQQCNALPPA